MDLNSLGLLAIKNNDCQEAVNIFRKALGREKNARSFLGLGLAYFHAGDFPTARWAFYKVLELDAGNIKALEHLKLIEEKGARSATPGQRGSYFRVGKGNLELLKEGAWRKFFVKGINMGLGLPGYFPGEYPILGSTYLKWFEQISDLGINALRIYTVHPPCFYEALARFNRTGGRLWLFQGIWAELPDDNDFYGPAYMDYIGQAIVQAVDVVYGAANLPEKPGYAHGRYESDVSAYTAAFVFGREWEPCAVKKFNSSRPGSSHDYRGDFLAITGGTAFESWVAHMCDRLQSHEHRKYAHSHPVSTACWPTLDPLDHPSESKHEDELTLQGVKTVAATCNENEDMESLDVGKIRVVKGNGFFATYHVYPYYPDFMNNDYADQPDAYLAYLRDLKKHHGDQPVLIAEFGLPSSREITHWQKDGWHHGGCDDHKQGEGNCRLMRSIHRAGMAGGMLFSWFDEWFKRNWLFLPYELPSERKPLWFNLQDAEENYGLLAAYPGYPGKAVTLSGKTDEWADAATIYRKKSIPPLFTFNDGFDGARTLRRLLARHDEGFLYLLLETDRTVDFDNAGYIIGLDTCDPSTGEFLMPLGTNQHSPVGLKFAVHLAGKGKSRILVCKGYDKYLNRNRGEIKPAYSDQGEWVVMQNRTNSRRISKDGTRFFPSRVFSMSTLKFGSLDTDSPHYTSLADFHVAGNIIELRIPWGLINFTDPSSRKVLWLDDKSRSRVTDGIRIVAVSFKPGVGCPGARDTGAGVNVTDALPARLSAENVTVYSWDGWDTPLYHTFLKQSYYRYREVLAGIRDGG